MPSHVETPSRIFGHAVGKTTFRSRLAALDRERMNLHIGTSNYRENLPDRRMQPSSLTLQTKLNQDLRTGTFPQRSTVSRTFGLHLQLPSSHTESVFNQRDSDVNTRDAVSTVSRTFGLVPDSANTHNNEISNNYMRRSDSVNASLIPRTLNLQTRNLTMQSHFLSENDLRGNSNLDLTRRSNMSVVSRRFGGGAQRGEGGGGFNSYDNEGFIQDLKRNGIVNSSLVAKPFGHHSRNLTVHSSFLTERNPNSKLNTLSTAFKSFDPADGGSTLLQERATCNDEIVDNGGFRRPTLSRVIRGRNSLLSSRLFHSQNAERNYRDLSSINGFNGDSLSESRMVLNGRSNWGDNQSMTGSVLSTASMKGQFMNLLESLHHSILSIGPNVTAEAVRMEFDKAKQGLENICEMSLASSVRETDAASIISQSSKYACPPVNDVVLDGGSLRLKSSKEVLKSLISRKNSCRSQLNIWSRAEEEFGGTSKDSDEEVSEFLFKKPRQPPKRKKTQRSVKVKTSSASPPEAASKTFALKQWYPVAVGPDLALCGVDEKGVAVKTDAVKKRVNNRKVELVSGLVCNLVGSPSSMVSVLPKKIAGLLKNGLTERWRVLQRELASCQTPDEDRMKRKSRSPKVVRSPKKAVAAVKGTAMKAKKSSPKPRAETQRANKRKSKNHEVMVSPKNHKVLASPKSHKVVASPRSHKGVVSSRNYKVLASLKSQNVLASPKSHKVLASPKSHKGVHSSKNHKVLASPKRSKNDAGVLTRSGRTVKPPTMYWLVGGSGEVSSSQISATPAATSTGKSPKKEYKRNERSPLKGQQQHAKGGGHVGGKAAIQSKHSSSFRGKVEEMLSKVRSPKKNKKKEREERQSEVDSSTGDGPEREIRGNKRKREVSGDVDAVETKKSKLEKIKEMKAENIDSVTKKKNKASARSTKVKAKKSPAKKSVVKKNKKIEQALKETESVGTAQEKMVNEFEEDFELQLDDIEIPEIASVSGNPQLSRSQLRVVSMETPPLKYFNSNLRLLRSATPVRSPDWCISQRSESEVKRFQKRREEAFKKKTRVDVKQTIVTEKTTKGVQTKELKKVMEWIAEKTVKSPAWNSKVVQYFIPSRKQRELQDDDEQEEEEDVFLRPSFG